MTDLKTTERPWAEVELELACATISDMQTDVAFTLSLAGLMRREDREIAYAAEIARLRRVELAARNVAETLNGGFVVCSRCADQETTTNLDYARELYAALEMELRK